MENLGYYNGKYDLIENMTVPMNDRACYFGDGIFEVTYTRNHIPYALDEHMDRLYLAACELGIDIPITKEEFLIKFKRESKFCLYLLFLISLIIISKSFSSSEFSRR